MNNFSKEVTSASGLNFAAWPFVFMNRFPRVFTHSQFPVLPKYNEQQRM